MSGQGQPYFSKSYAEARQKFRKAISEAIKGGHEVDHIVLKHPLCTAKGEELTTDIAWLGPKDAQAILLVTSGLHGVEGYAGSAVQIKTLSEHKSLPKDTAIVFVHALNPYGFKNSRRVNEDNTDLNRNFIDWSKTPPAPHHLNAKLQDILVPRHWNWTLALARGAWFVLRHGMKELQAALTTGQYYKADGLFYGGAKAAWTNAVMRDVVRACTTKAAYLAHVDIHTGLGKSGATELILAQPSDSKAGKRAKKWWGDTVKSVADGKSVSADVSGCIEGAHSKTDKSKCETTVIGLEFGTKPPFTVLKALAFDNWANNVDKNEDNIAKARRMMRDAFAPHDPKWEKQILAGGQKTLDQALVGLQNSLKNGPS